MTWHFECYDITAHSTIYATAIYTTKKREQDENPSPKIFTEANHTHTIFSGVGDGKGAKV